MKLKFRFGLKTLLIVTTLLGLVLIPFVLRLNHARKQKEAVDYVLSKNGSIIYETAYQDDVFSDFIHSNEKQKSTFLIDLLGTDFFYEVESIYISKDTEIEKLTALSAAQHLDYSSGKFQFDCKHTKHLPNLQSIFIRYDICHLYEFDLPTHAPKLDVSALKDLSKLKSLKLEKVIPHRLDQLTQIEELHIIYCLNPNYDFLNHLPRLKRLDVEFSDVQSLEPFQQLTQLTHLTLADNNIQDISSLARLTNLKYIDLQGNYDLKHLPDLKAWQNVYHMNLEYNEISDISPIAEVKNLRDLELKGTRVSDLTPLSSLTQLRRLDLGYTKVSDLSPLYNLKNLKHLSVRSTNVTKNEIESFRKKVPGCTVYARFRINEVDVVKTYPPIQE